MSDFWKFLWMLLVVTALLLFYAVLSRPVNVPVFYVGLCLAVVIGLVAAIAGIVSGKRDGK